MRYQRSSGKPAAVGVTLREQENQPIHKRITDPGQDSWCVPRQTKKDVKFAGREDQRWKVIRGFIPTVAEKNRWISKFSLKKDWEWLRTTSVSSSILQKRRFNRVRKTCARRLWNQQRRESSELLTHVATLSKPWVGVQAVHSLEESSWLVVFWLIGKRRKILWNSTKQRTRVSYVTTQFRPISYQDHQHQRWIRKVRNITKKSRRDRNLRVRIKRPRDIGNERDRWENLKHSCFFLRKTMTARTTFDGVGVPTEAEYAQYSADVVKTLGGLNAHISIWTGSQVFGALVQLRIVEQARNRLNHLHNKVLGIDARPFSKMHQKRNRWPIKQRWSEDPLRRWCRTLGQMKTTDNADGCEKNDKYRQQLIFNGHESRTAKLGLSNERMTQWQRRTPPTTSVAWADTFGKVAYQANWRINSSSGATPCVSVGLKDWQRTWTTQNSWEKPQARRAKNTPIFFVVVSMECLVGQIVAMERINQRLLPATKVLECLWWPPRTDTRAGEKIPTPHKPHSTSCARFLQLHSQQYFCSQDFSNCFRPQYEVQVSALCLRRTDILGTLWLVHCYLACCDGSVWKEKPLCVETTLTHCAHHSLGGFLGTEGIHFLRWWAAATHTLLTEDNESRAQHRNAIVQEICRIGFTVTQSKEDRWRDIEMLASVHL